MQKTLFIKDTAAMLALGAKFATYLDKPSNLYLHGDLGAGKTTLARGFIQHLGHQSKIKSPTYTLVEPYYLPNITIYHFDFYRIHAVEELDLLGIRDYFSGNAHCIVEWPEIAAHLLPEADLTCYITNRNEGRQVKLIAHSTLAKALMSKLDR